MSDYEICKTGQGYLLNRDGVRLGIFSEKRLADEFVFAHRTFKKSVSGKYEPVLSKNSEYTALPQDEYSPENNRRIATDNGVSN